MARLGFEGRVAVVTGAGRGMGRTHALLLAERGAKVLVNDLGADAHMDGFDPGPAASVVSEIEAAGGEAAANTQSVGTRDGAHAIVSDAVARWGRIDILVNNAGGGSEPTTIDRVEESVVRHMFDVHFFGAWHTIAASWPHMMQQQYGRIVNISSASCFGLSGEYAYASAKSALIGLTKSIALDGIHHNIKANLVMPVAATRLIDTVPRADLRAWIMENFPPQKVSAVVAALVHESVPFTGEAINAGRGQAARIFYGVSKGISEPDITPEMVLERVDEIVSTEGFVVGGSDGSFLGDDTDGRTGQGWLDVED